MTTDEEADELRARLTDAVADILAGTTFAPPEGGIVTDVVVVTGWRDTDGSAGFSYIGASTPWATEGLLGSAFRQHTARDDEDGDE